MALEKFGHFEKLVFFQESVYLRHHLLELSEASLGVDVISFTLPLELLYYAICVVFGCLHGSDVVLFLSDDAVFETLFNGNHARVDFKYGMSEWLILRYELFYKIDLR